MCEEHGRGGRTTPMMAHRLSFRRATRSSPERKPNTSIHADALRNLERIAQHTPLLCLITAPALHVPS